MCVSLSLSFPSFPSASFDSHASLALRSLNQNHSKHTKTGKVVRAPCGVMHGKTSPVHHTGVGLLEGLEK